MVVVQKSAFIGLVSTLAFGAFADDLGVVIDQQGAQVSLSIQGSGDLPFPPDLETLTFLDGNPPSVNLPTSEYNWPANIGKKVTVEHRHRNLSYSGTLREVRGNLFTLSTQQGRVTLPTSDFYLVTDTLNEPTSFQYQGRLTYRTQQLFWSPKRTVVVDNRNVSIIESAQISNQSDSATAIKNALLRDGQSPAPRLERSTLAMSMADQKTASFTDGETIYELKKISLAPYATQLVPLSNSQYKIDERYFTSSVSGWESNQPLSLNFTQSVEFKPKANHPKGWYQLLWDNKTHLIPSGDIYLDTLNSDTTATVQLTQSPEITGNIQLIASTKHNGGVKQTWELELTNHSRQQQETRVKHLSPNVIQRYSPNWMTSSNARSVEIKSTLAAKATYRVRYTLELEQN